MRSSFDNFVVTVYKAVLYTTYYTHVYKIKGLKAYWGSLWRRCLKAHIIDHSDFWKKVPFYIVLEMSSRLFEKSEKIHAVCSRVPIVLSQSSDCCRVCSSSRKKWLFLFRRWSRNLSFFAIFLQHSCSKQAYSGFYEL